MTLPICESLTIGVTDHLGKEVTSESYVLEHVLNMKEFKELHIGSLTSGNFLKNLIMNLKLKVNINYYLF